MGHYTYKGPSVRVLCEERVQTGRYAADYGVAFPDLLNTACGQGPVTTHEIVPTFLKTNRTILKIEAHLQR